MKRKLRAIAHAVALAAAVAVIADWTAGFEVLQDCTLRVGRLRYTWLTARFGGGGVELLYQRPTVSPRADWLNGRTLSRFDFQRQKVDRETLLYTRYAQLDFMRRPPSFAGSAVGFVWYRDANPMNDGSPAIFRQYSLFIPYWFVVSLLLATGFWPLGAWAIRAWRQSRARGFEVMV